MQLHIDTNNGTMILIITRGVEVAAAGASNDDNNCITVMTKIIHDTFIHRYR